MSSVNQVVLLLIDALSEKYGFTFNNDINFVGTHDRVARAYDEILAGYTQNPADILSARFPSENYDQMIVVKDIRFFSMCAHHMLPFYGKAAIGYLPGEGRRVVGLSKLARLVHCFARRFQIQEALTQEIARAMQEHLNPAGVGVYLYDCVHLCMHMRGVKESSSTMETSALLGSFRDEPEVRTEFFSHFKG